MCGQISMGTATLRKLISSRARMVLAHFRIPAEQLWYSHVTRPTFPYGAGYARLGENNN